MIYKIELTPKELTFLYQCISAKGREYITRGGGRDFDFEDNLESFNNKITEARNNVVDPE